MGECVVEIIGILMHYVMFIVFISFVFVVGIGSAIFAIDEYREWQDRRDYDAMAKSRDKKKETDK